MSLRSLLILATLRETLTDPDPVVTIQCRRVGNDYLVAFAQPFEYLDSAYGVASQLDCATFGLGAIRTQHKHSDGLLRLTKCRPADLQNVPESLQLDRSVYT